MTYHYTAPEISELVHHPEQQRIVDICMEAIEDIGDALWSIGRGAGKSTVRGMIAHAILTAEEHPLYEVKAIER